MVLAIEPEDRGWEPCEHRQRVEGRRVCTYGPAIYINGLGEPSEEIVYTLKRRKPWLLEFGQLKNSITCRDCPYNDSRRQKT